MTRRVIWPGVSVQTLDQLRRKHRRLDRTRTSVARALTAMQRGNTLHLSFERGMRRWTLSDGSGVPDEIAKIVTSDHRIHSVGDALFKGMAAQTFRFSED